ncbi:hypothetical protein M0812_23143 [Anaeramoeba flamelloides]|uniref:Uncharacterized protein n=1 Tax=Anaeramoeba flamelloides TaxID=1746091 RepID=A0AAV7YQB0_9EUKA|nr:hypothetical protein M0812_23143 [Anaeramoeba flamelloides]
MNQLKQTRSSSFPIRTNKLEQMPIRSQSDCYFNRFSRPDLIVPQPKKNLASKRFNNTKFSKYDFSKELSQFVSPIEGLIETKIEDKSETRFEQEDFLEELIQNTKNLTNEEKKIANCGLNDNGNGSSIGNDYNKEKMLAFSPPKRTKCPLWQDNKFSRMVNLDKDFGEFENLSLENMF